MCYIASQSEILQVDGYFAAGPNKNMQSRFAEGVLRYQNSWSYFLFKCKGICNNSNYRQDLLSKDCVPDLWQISFIRSF